jgi:hypothetical protein
MKEEIIMSLSWLSFICGGTLGLVWYLSRRVDKCFAELDRRLSAIESSLAKIIEKR